MGSASERDIYDLIAELTGTEKSKMNANENASLSSNFPLDDMEQDLSVLQKERLSQTDKTSPAQDAELAKNINKESIGALHEKKSDAPEDIESQLKLLNTKLELLNRKSLKSEIVNELRLSNERILQQVNQSKEAIQLDIARLENQKPKEKDSFIKWLGVLNLMLSALIIGYLFFQKMNQTIVAIPEDTVSEKPLLPQQELPQQNDLPNASTKNNIVNKPEPKEAPEEYIPSPNSYSEETVMPEKTDKVFTKPSNIRANKPIIGKSSKAEIQKEDTKDNLKSKPVESASENEAVYFGED